MNGMARLALVAMLTTMSVAAQAADKITVGYIATLSGPIASQGEELLRGFRLALDQLGGTLGDRPAELVVVDDQWKPQNAVQLARRLVEKDKVDLIAGLLFANIAEAVQNAVLPQNAVVVGTSGITSNRAGKDCHPNSFSVFWNTEAVYEAIGAYLKRKEIKKPYLIALNYQSGKDALAGFKLGYGTVAAGETYTRLDQTEFAAELTQIRAAAPDALVLFMPGGNGMAFMKQFAQAGLAADVPMFGMVVQADEMVFPAVGDAVVGMTTVGNWNPSLDNDANRRFVREFRARHRVNPTTLAAMGYDNAMLIDAAVREVKGDLSDRDAFRLALRKARFESVRGSFRFNNNHVPIQDMYVNRVTKGPDGTLFNQLVEVAVREQRDPFHKECKMSW